MTPAARMTPTIEELYALRLQITQALVFARCGETEKVARALRDVSDASGGLAQDLDPVALVVRPTCPAAAEMLLAACEELLADVPYEADLDGQDCECGEYVDYVPLTDEPSACKHTRARAAIAAAPQIPPPVNDRLLAALRAMYADAQANARVLSDIAECRDTDPAHSAWVRLRDMRASPDGDLIGLASAAIDAAEQQQVHVVADLEAAQRTAVDNNRRLGISEHEAARIIAESVRAGLSRGGRDQ